MMIVWRQSRGSPRPRSRYNLTGAFTIIHGGALAINVVGTMNIVEEDDIASFTGIVGIVSGNNGVMWSIMQNTMFPIPYAIMQSDENDS